MKAIGVDSLSYKSLFIVKYIAFALLGGMIGSLAGTALCRYMIRNFITNTLNPDSGVLIAIGVVISLLFVLLMILFSYMALRRMRKISVMDTIHGENRGERFRKLPGVFLHKSRRMSVPLFLAGNDIAGRIKRYLYLIVSYTMGILVLLMVVQIKNTIVCDEFRRTYWGIADRTVMIRPEDELRDRLIDQEGSYRSVFLYYEKYYNEHGIPLNIQVVDEQDALLITSGERSAIVLQFGDYEIERLKLVKGGRTPELPNEVVVSHTLKELKGVDLGDTITLEYKVYGEDGFTTEMVQKDFIVTGYVESAQRHVAFMLPNAENIVGDDWTIFNEGLDVPDREYRATIEKMRAVNEDIRIWDFDQALDFNLGNQYGTLLDMLLVTMGIIIAVTTFAMTFLYEQIFMEEETSDIAMLKSLGVDKASIKRWHYERILLLVAAAAVFAAILAFTVSKLLFNGIGRAALRVAEFHLASPSLQALVLLPLGIAMIVTVVMAVSFQSMNRIQIWRIRNE